MQCMRPSRARPKAAKAFAPEFRLPLPSIEPLYISSDLTLPLFHLHNHPFLVGNFSNQNHGENTHMVARKVLGLHVAI